MAYRTTNYGVAMSWAKAQHDEAQTGNGNMSHTGNKLWSYNTPIAMLHTAANGERVALVTTETYSVTTEGKHKNACGAALRRCGIQHFYVPFLLLDGYTYGRSTAGRIAIGYSATEQHAANVEDYDKRIAAERERLARARVHKDEARLNALVAERAAYVYAFQL